MQNHPKLGEIIVPGPARSSGIRSFILTDTKSSGQSTEMLFGLIAAEAPKRIVDKMVDRLIDEIRPAFFSSPDDVEDRYEQALKQANRSLLAYLHEYHLSLPGIKLRGFMAALSGESLFVTNRGSLKGLLLIKKPEKTVSLPLFSEGVDTSTNPKFFSSFQQGIMPAGSVFIAGTKELFSSVDEPYLKRVFTERDSSDAGRELRKGLSDKPNVAAITLAMPSEAPAEAMVKEPITVPSLTPKKSRRRRSGDLPTHMDIGEMGAKSIEGLLVFLLTYLKMIPKAIVSLFRGLVMLLRLLAHVPKAALALADRTRRKALFDGAKNMPKHVARTGLHRFNALPNRSKAHLLLLIAVSALFIHGILFTFNKHSEALAAKAYEAKLAEIGQLQTDLETSIIIGNDRRSHDAIARLTALIDALPIEESDEIKTKQELSDDLQVQRDKLRRYVTISDPETLTTFEDPDGLFVDGLLTWFDRSLYLLSPSGTAVKSFGLDGSSAVETISAPSKIRDVAPARTGVLLALEDGSIGFWQPGSEKVIVYPDIALGDSPILFYQGRLYTVSDAGMIERRPILDGKLGAAANVLQTPSDLSHPSSIAADGSAYLLSKDGQLRKYLKGTPVEGFTSPVLDPAPRRSKNLWADVNSRWLVFLEQSENRIVMLDSSSGRLAAQLVSPAFGTISSMSVDANGDYAYLVSGNRILSVPLKGPGIN